MFTEAKVARTLRAGRRATGLVGIVVACGLAVAPIKAQAAGTNQVRIWNQRAIVTLVSGTGASPAGFGFPPPVTLVHLAMVQGAVYDAVNAIKGGHDPYLGGIKAATSASKPAAAATAAYMVLSGIVYQHPTLDAAVKSTIQTRLNAEYADSMLGIPEGEARDKGVEVGTAAAVAMLANRANDGRYGAPGFSVSTAPGGWRPLSSAPNANDLNGWVRSVRPFTLPAPETFHTPGPFALTSAEYAAEFDEVKAKGAATGSTRTPAQTLLAYWTVPNPVPMTFGAFRQVSAAKNLTISQEARFYAMTSMSGADAAINCFAEKEHWGFWRPTTAIRLADTDGNPATAPDPAWSALLPVPPYPDEPSGANCVYGSLMTSARLFFGSDVASFQIASAGIGGDTGSTRSYSRFSDVITDMIEARLFGGLHFRRANVNGAELGKKVAAYVDANFFNCSAPGQCKQEERE